MSLKETIDQDIKKAMLAKNQDELRALRAIKSMILLAQTEGGSKGEVDEKAEISILQKAAKQRKDSIEVYENQGRSDLAGEEKAELEVIERYLPEMMSEADVENLVREAVAESGASSMQDMGKVMPLVIKKAAGGADNKLISTLVRKVLSE